MAVGSPDERTVAHEFVDELMKLLDNGEPTRVLTGRMVELARHHFPNKTQLIVQYPQGLQDGNSLATAIARQLLEGDHLVAPDCFKISSLKNGILTSTENPDCRVANV